jgi:Domain of unknown function (DUF5071)
MATDIQDLVPLSKGDVQRAEAAAAAGYPAVEPILGDLMVWLQDYNWPVAHVLAPFLRGIGPVDPLVAIVRAILDGDDSVWKYHVLYQVVDGWDARGIARIASQLERLAGTPDAGDVAEGVDEAAGIMLARMNTQPHPQ